MATTHHFQLSMTWTGNRGQGTADYRAYGRNHELETAGKYGPILGSSAPTFRGDRDRYNPEELLVGALSSCHMLAFLHFCADAGVVVTEYRDEAAGVMRVNPDGSGEFLSVTLHPQVTISDPARTGEIASLHHKAHEACFIARSVNFPVLHEATVVTTL